MKCFCSWWRISCRERRQKETLVLQVWCCRRIRVVWMLDTFKLSCVLLWTFSTWCTQRICLLNPCQPKKWEKHYRLMVSACQTRIPKGSMMTPTTRIMTVRETYTQCIVLSNKVCLVWWCHNVDELNSKQIYPCVRVYGHACLRSFRKKLLIVYSPQRDSTLKKTFQSNVFSEKWNDNEKPNKKSEKRESGKDK